MHSRLTGTSCTWHPHKETAVAAWLINQPYWSAALVAEQGLTQRSLQPPNRPRSPDPMGRLNIHSTCMQVTNAAGQVGKRWCCKVDMSAAEQAQASNTRQPQCQTQGHVDTVVHMIQYCEDMDGGHVLYYTFCTLPNRAFRLLVVI